MIPLLDLSRQYGGLESEMRAALDEVLREQSFVLGPRVARFERELATYLGMPHVVGVKSGSDALLLALLSLGIGAGDEVLTTPFSFFATAGAIARTGAKPVFADVRPDTLGLDPRAAARAIGPRTRAIIVVHLFGQPVELDEFMGLANRHGLALIEDAAQALGASYRGRAVGGFGRVGCFSFHPSKPLGAFGDAGAVVTADPDLSTRVAALRNHGALSRYEHELAGGGNHRLDALQAAVLSVKLPRLRAWLDARREHAAAYDEAFRALPGVTAPPRVAGTQSSYSVYTLRVANGRRDALRAHLAESGIATAVHYPKPLHLQGAFGKLGYTPGSFPEAERAASEVLSIPLFPELRAAERERVASAVRSYVEGTQR